MSPSSKPEPALNRLARWSYRRRRRVVVLWLSLLGGVLALAAGHGGEFAMEFRTPGAESARAQDLLQDRFAVQAGASIDVVMRAEAGVDDPHARALFASVLAEAAANAHVVRVTSPYDPGGDGQISSDRRIAYATLQLDVDEDEAEHDPVAGPLLRIAERATTSDVQIELGGPAVEASEHSEFGSERVGLAAAALILLLTFGSALAMGLPIVVALIGLGIASGLMALVANVVDVPEFGPQVAAMVGIGVGIDYVLFIVTRYRNELAAGHDPEHATVAAIASAGRAVLFAGCTVIISLLGLFVMGLEFLQGLAVSTALGVLVIMAASITFLPALLGFVGRHIDRFRVPFLRRERHHQNGFWYRWSRFIQRRPWPAALGAIVAIFALVLPLAGARDGFPDAGNNSPERSSRRAYDLLSEGFGPGFNGPLLMVTELPPGSGTDPSGLLAPTTAAIEATPGVVEVSPPFPSPDGTIAVQRVIPATAPQDEATEELVATLREDVLPMAGLPVSLTGATAATIDISDYMSGRLPWLIGSVVVLSFLLLLVVFRSLLVALKAALMNVLSVLAAFGVVALATNGGWLGNLIGIEEAVPVPTFNFMMIFAILFGLSMDYEVFLLSRVREEYLRTGDNARSVADGLASTARVITAAAAIMVAVFLAFVFHDDVYVKMVGIGMATAILVDATIVRMVLVPATMELLGDANWWLPRWLDRLLPEVHVEGVALAGASAEPSGHEVETLVGLDEGDPHVIGGRRAEELARTD